MIRRLTRQGPAVREDLSLPPDLGDSSHLLATLYKSSTVGVAICDRQLRYRAINDALASMNGVPARAHIGKTIHAVLGKVAAKIQPAFEHVFATGEPLWNFELRAKLPERATPARWNEHYFPLKDKSDNVQHVGAVVLELTRREELRDLISQIASHLTVVESNIRVSLGDPRPSQVRPRKALATSIDLLRDCLKNVQMLSHLLDSAPSYQALQPSSRDFSALAPIEDPLALIDPLSSREREVISLLASGKNNRDISALLSISKRTVETHRAKIMLKLNLHSLSDLVRYALRTRLVQP